MAQTPPETIETILLEERRYPPSEEFAAQANATAEIYDRDFDEFGETEGLVFDWEVEQWKT